MKLSGLLSGGGGHGHEPFKVPHYTIYNNYRECPELAAHEERLARLGLKDPWMRNHVHLFSTRRVRRGRFAEMWHVLKPGFWYGFGIAAGIIAIEETYSYVKHGHTSWGGH